jgi:hypothetical protein
MQYVTTHVFPIIGSDSGPIVGHPSITVAPSSRIQLDANAIIDC